MTFFLWPDLELFWTFKVLGAIPNIVLSERGYVCFHDCFLKSDNQNHSKLKYLCERKGRL